MDASARQQPDALAADEPRGGVGRITRVGVLRQDADEAAAGELVQPGEHEGERRLRDAGSRRERFREALEALVVDELGDQRVQYRAVHVS